jgi:thiol-disulfide isomerase/thioredoxin
MDTFTSRLFIALALSLLGLAAYFAYNRWVIRHAQSRRLGLESALPGIPTILYFTTPTCVPCRTVQAPALERLSAKYHDAMQVIKIDAQEHPEVADHWGVLTVPTTFVIDPTGKARYFNPGVALAEKLQQQLEQVGVNVNG